jgi:hypothetical protein
MRAMRPGAACVRERVKQKGAERFEQKVTKKTKARNERGVSVLALNADTPTGCVPVQG